MSRYILCDENNTGCLVGTRPPVEEVRWTDDMADAVDNSRLPRHLLNGDKAFQAQEARPTMLSDRLQQHGQCKGGDGSVPGHGKRVDQAVTPRPIGNRQTFG